MKAVKVISSVIFILSMLFLGCSDDNGYVASEGEESLLEEQISGNSFLKVTNECPECNEVFFDDKYIGQVEEGGTRVWDVPVGLHAVRVYGLLNGRCSKDIDFKDGIMSIMCIELNADNQFDLEYDESVYK